MIDRAEGLLDEAALNNTHIVFVGLGSGGSAGLDLLRYQFRRIDLIDPDKLAKENVVRHVLTARDIGRYKVEAMREAMTHRNISPSTMFAHAARVEDVLHKIPKPDILVVGIDDPVSQAFVNSWCVENGVFALYPGVYAKGVGGQIIVVPTPKDLCQQCAVVMMGMPAAERPTGPSNYGVDINALTEKKVKAVPCLSWAITSIASEVARYVVQFINGVPIEPQVFVRIHESAEVIRLSQEVLPAMSDFIVSQSAMGLMPLFTMGQNGTLVLHRGSITHPNKRWHRCPHHGQQQSLGIGEI